MMLILDYKGGKIPLPPKPLNRSLYILINVWERIVNCMNCVSVYEKADRAEQAAECRQTEVH